MRAVIIFLFLFHGTLKAQVLSKKGVLEWDSTSSWTGLISRAKSESKYIFIDCTATWCGPCKKMDAEVFSDSIIAKLLANKFVSVKVQMDSTPRDNDYVRAWYKTANQIRKQYSVAGYPTFLFFSSDGKPLHKSIGFKNVQEFKNMISEFLDSTRRYYSILETFRAGVIDINELKGLARSFYYSDRTLAGKIAFDYVFRIPASQKLIPDNIKFVDEFRFVAEIKKNTLCFVDSITKVSGVLDSATVALLSIFNYDSNAVEIAKRILDEASEKELYDKSMLTLLNNFCKFIEPGDRYFKFIFRNSKRIDRIWNERNLNSSVNILDYILYNKMVLPELEKLDSAINEINWDYIGRRIINLTNAPFGRRSLLEAQLNWYRYKTLRAEQTGSKADIWGLLYVDVLVRKIDKYGLDISGDGYKASMVGNDIEYSIYQYCCDTLIVQKAIAWLEKVMKSSPGISFGYVYAGLLYRIGYVKDAIAWQQMTIQVAEGRFYEEKKDIMSSSWWSSWYKSQTEILGKMRMGASYRDMIFRSR